ncbi:MAG: polyphenol oxidase family protein [Actinomycetota bacterium]
MTEGAPLLRARLGRVEIVCSAAEHGNVGDHVGDDPAVVTANRAAFAGAAGLPPPASWVWLRQVHGATVFRAGAVPRTPPEADAAVTTVPGLPLAVVTADCAPVVLASPSAAAVVHAGHRGLAAGVIEAAVADLREAGPGEIRAFLGPCIRPVAYEFGATDLAGLAERLGPTVVARTADGRPAFDVPAAVTAALGRADVGPPFDCGACTATTPGYFSHRRDGAPGRQVTVAVLT